MPVTEIPRLRRELPRTGWRLSRRAVATLLVCLLVPAAAPVARVAPQELVLELDPARTKVNFTLGATLHTVHGTFALKHGAIRFDPANGTASGEIVVDAASGQSGSESRDKEMHQKILESARFPEITFRPDRVEGKVAAQGASSVQVHGLIAIHGASHEVTAPVQAQLSGDHWTATAKFTVPYTKWGMKNPSTFLLRVSDTVVIDLEMAGSILPAPQK